MVKSWKNNLPLYVFILAVIYIIVASIYLIANKSTVTDEQMRPVTISIIVVGVVALSQLILLLKQLYDRNNTNNMNYSTLDDSSSSGSSIFSIFSTRSAPSTINY